MGIGTITPARETTRGAYASPEGNGAVRLAGLVAGTTAQAGRAVREEIRRAGDSVAGAVGSAVDTVRRVGDLWNRITWEDPINKAMEKIREADVEARKVQHVDYRGVMRPGIETEVGREAVDAAERWQQHMEIKSRAIAKECGLDKDQYGELMRRMQGWRTETFANLKEWGTIQAAGAFVEDSKYRRDREFERHGTELFDRPRMVEQSLGALGANEETTKAIGEKADDTFIGQYVDNMLTSKSSFAEDLVMRSLGRVSRDKAEATTDAAMRTAAVQTVKRMADGGNAKMAKALVAKLDRLGFTAEDQAALSDNIDVIAARAFEKQRKAVGARFDVEEAKFAANTESDTWAATYRKWASDRQLVAADPKRAADYAAKADRLDRLEALRVKGELQTDPQYWKYERDPKKLRESLDNQLAEIIAGRIGGADPREVQKKQEAFFFRLKEENVIGDLAAKDGLALATAAQAELDKQSVDAIRDLWNELGMPYENIDEKTGMLTKAAADPKFKHEKELTGLGGQVFGWSDALAMTGKLLAHLRANPNDVNDKEAVRGFIRGMRIGVLEKKTGDDLNKAALKLMTEIETGALRGWFMPTDDGQGPEDFGSRRFMNTILEKKEEE